MHRTLLAAAALLPALVIAPAQADEVTDAIAAAQRAYQAGKLQETQTALQEAMQLIAQRAAAQLKAALPEPLPGWQAEEAQSSATGAAGLFSATTASRIYRNSQGQSVEIEIMTDNPMIAQVAAFITNPMLAGAMGRLIRIGDQRAIQGGDGNVQMLIDNRILVQVRGDAPPEAKLAYARAIPVGRLAGR
jgi:hypothetical protein